MKTSIKSLFVAAVAIFFAANANAQTTTTTTTTDTNYDQGFRLGFGITPGYVFNKPYNLGLGVDARLQYDLSKIYSVTLTTGYTNFFVSGEQNDLGFVPVKLGFKGFFWRDSFYLMGEAGAAFQVTNSNDQNSQTSAILAPSIGYANKYFDVSLRYEYYTKFQSYDDTPFATPNNGVSQIAVRFAYGFKL